MEPIEYQGTVERMLCERATERLSPINGILELTPLCNMGCAMCFVRLTPEQMRAQGRLRSGEEWIELARSMRAAGTLFVLLTGGEPLLHPDFRSIYAALREMGMILTINTNGTLIDEDMADFFARQKPRRINITLYGKDAETYGRLCRFPDGYDRARRAVRLLMERHVDVKINGSITPGNVGDLDALCAIAEESGTAWKFDTYMYPAHRERPQAFDADARLSPEQAAAVRVAVMRRQEGERFTQVAEGLLALGSAPEGEAVPSPVRCRAGRSSFIVNWQGMMRPCVMLNRPESDVFALGFDEAWRRTTQATAAIHMSAACSACTMRDACQTCAACAFLETGAFDGVPDYMCRYTRETLRLLRACVTENT